MNTLAWLRREMAGHRSAVEYIGRRQSLLIAYRKKEVSTIQAICTSITGLNERTMQLK